MATMRVAQVSRPGGPLKLVGHRSPEPDQGSMQDQLPGLRHLSQRRDDSKEGLWPGITFPRSSRGTKQSA